MPKLNEIPATTPQPTDITYLMSDDGVLDGKVELKNLVVIPETTRTINVNNTMTSS